MKETLLHTHDSFYLVSLQVMVHLIQRVHANRLHSVLLLLILLFHPLKMPDGCLTSSNGSVWPPSHDQHSVHAESLHPLAPMARFFSVVFSQCRTFSHLQYSSNVPSRTIFSFQAFLTQRIFLAHFGPLVV